MGGITPVITKGLGIAGAVSGLTGAIPGLSAATQILSAYNTISDQSGRQERSDQDLALLQLQQKQALQQQQLAAQTALEKEKIATSSAQAESERRAALRRAVAKQRANFGSQGVSGGGSSEAVLLGLFDESQDELKKREELDVLKTAALDQQVSQNQSLNLLQQAQLKEKQKFEREVSRYGNLF